MTVLFDYRNNRKAEMTKEIREALELASKQDFENGRNVAISNIKSQL